MKKMAYDVLNDFCCFLFFCCFGICFAVCLSIGEIFSKVCIGFGAENTFFTTPDVVCLILCFLSQNGLSQDVGFKDLLGVYMTP